MRGWHRPWPQSDTEEMSAEEDKRLFVSLRSRGLGKSTDRGGILRRKNGWIYGYRDGTEWAIPEAAIEKIEEFA